MADYNKKSVQSIVLRNRRIEKVLNIAFKDVSKRWVFIAGKPRKQAFLGRRIKGLQKQLKVNIEQELKQQWKLANKKIDIMTDGYLSNIKVSDQLYKSFRSPNLEALNTFLTRVEKGMNLSKRIWKLTDNAQIQLEDFLASGVTVGKPAVQVAKELKRYMNGKGVQYKGTLLKARNITWEALRLATTEANMAFRLAEQTKMGKLSFVTGCSIHLSGAHPRIDICDELVGDYPKGFIWSGWHPVCICFRTWRKLPKKAFVQFMKTGQIPKEAFIQKLPSKMNVFMKKNVEKLGGYVKRGTEPYWMRDNFNKDLTVKMGVGDIKLPDMKLVIPEVPVIPTVEWVETKSISGLQSGFDKLGIRSVTSGIGIADPELIKLGNEIGRELARLKNKYIGLKNIKKIGQLEFKTTKSLRGMTGQFDARDRLMTLADVSARKPELRFKGYNIGNDLKTNFRHEYAHGVHKQLLPSEGKEWARIFNSKSKTEWSKISKYASTKETELFAESFASFTSPLYKKKMLPREVEEFMEKLLKPRMVN